MNGFLRRGSRALLLCSLVCALLGSTLSVAWHDGADDEVCAPTIVAHNHAAHRLAPGALAAAATDHCVLCHSQSVRFTTPAGTAHVVVLLAGETSPATAAAVRPGIAGARDARGPPLA